MFQCSLLCVHVYIYQCTFVGYTCTSAFVHIVRSTLLMYIKLFVHNEEREEGSEPPRTHTLPKDTEAWGVAAAHPCEKSVEA